LAQDIWLKAGRLVQAAKIVAMSGSGETFRSKIGNAYAKSFVEDCQTELKAELAAMKKQGRNRQCFDCGAADVTWASPKLGTFICVTCSDVHRAAGAHITCVKNFSTYLWSPDEVEMMRSVGNTRAKDLFRPGSEVSWQPAESKEQKVRHCTKLYGADAVQLAVKRHVEAATAVAGPNATPQSSHPFGGYPPNQSRGLTRAAAWSVSTEPGQSQSFATPSLTKKEAMPNLLSDDFADWLGPASGLQPDVQPGPDKKPAGPWQSQMPVAPTTTTQHDLMDLFPPVPSSSPGPLRAAPVHCGAFATKAAESEKDFWASVNWDELLK